MAVQSASAHYRNVSESKLRIFASGFFVFAGISLWQQWPAALTGSLSVLGIAGLVRPIWIRPLYAAWMFAAQPIGWAITQLVLAVVYFGVVTPVALAKRLFGSEMPMRPDPKETTYWIEQPPEPDDPESYFRQY